MDDDVHTVTISDLIQFITRFERLKSHVSEHLALPKWALFEVKAQKIPSPKNGVIFDGFSFVFHTDRDKNIPSKLPDAMTV
jgi:hypothetical protein